MRQPDTVLLLDDNIRVLEYISRVIDQPARDNGITVVSFTVDVEARVFVLRSPTAIRGYIQDLHRDEADPHTNHGLHFLRETIVTLTPWARTVIFTGHGTYDDAVESVSLAGTKIRLLEKRLSQRDDELREAFMWLIEPRDFSEHEPWRVATPTDLAAIEIVQPAWDEVCRAIAVTPTLLHQINPRMFERLVAEIFRSYGCDVELTAATRDRGYDIIAVKLNSPTSLRILIEAKRFAPDRPVGVEFVRALYGIKATNSASQVVLATTSHISRPAKKEFERFVPWELEYLEREAIHEWCRQYGTVKLKGTLG